MDACFTGNCDCNLDSDGRYNPPGFVLPETLTKTVIDNRVINALAKIIVDNKVIARTVELYELGVVRVEDLISQITADKESGVL